MEPFFEEPNHNRWNEFVNQASNGHLMQGYEWGQFKAQAGWRVQRVGLKSEGQIVAGAQLLFRSLPKLPLTLAYLSKGPLVNVADTALAEQLWPLIHQAARQNQAVFLMAEPNWPDSPAHHAHLQEQGFHVSRHTNHPHSTMIVDLRPDEAAMLKGMRKKTRQLIRKAERAGIEIVAGTDDDLDDFYQTLAVTADLKNIAGHEREFYQHVWQMYAPRNQAKLFLAKHNGQTVAAKMIFTFGQRSLHLWGGTKPEGRRSNASYLIQWESLRWAKQQGFQEADLWGIPDEVGQQLKDGHEPPKDKQTDLWGVYLFKRGFGGQVESYVGTYDYVYKPLWYRLAKMATRVSVDTLSQWAERLKLYGRRETRPS